MNRRSNLPFRVRPQNQITQLAITLMNGQSMKCWRGEIIQSLCNKAFSPNYTTQCATPTATVHQKTNFRHPPITSHSVVKEEEASPCSPSSSCTRTVNTEPTRSGWSGKGHLQTWTLVIWFGPVRWWWQWLWMGLPMCTQDEAAVYLAASSSSSF